MAKYLPGDPNLDYDFGQDFDYSLWTPGTTIDLVNVPWNNDYRDVVKFADTAALDTYINSLGPSGTKVTHLSYVKPNQPIRINIPHTRVNRFNYLRASNPLQPITGDMQKNYYYFILGCNYVAPNTTEIILQLDVWQTYIYDLTLGNCYVERGHIGIANENGFTNYGRDYLTVPEGIDTGSDLRIVESYRDVLMTPRAKTVPHNSGVYNVVVISTVQLDQDPGDKTDPKLMSAWGSEGLGMPGGASVFAWQSHLDYAQWLISMTTKPWHTQGIISASIVPPLENYYPDMPPWNPDPYKPTKLEIWPPLPVTHNLVSNWRNALINALPAKYQILKKFLTTPYSVVELTTLTGNPITLKPELWSRDDAIIREFANLIPPSAKYVFFPDGYNGPGSDNDRAEGFDHSTAIVNPPTMSVVNNMGISYLASHNYSLGWAKDSAGWAQNRALHSAATAYDNTKQGIGTDQTLAAEQKRINTEQMLLGNRSAGAQAAISDVANPLAGLVGGGMGGNANTVGLGLISGVIQAAAGTASMVNNVNTASAANDITNSQITYNTRQTTQLANYVNDTNNDLAKFAANGDYANAIAGINAQIHDTNMIQPSVSGQQGGDVLNFLSDIFGIHLRIKLIDPAAIRRIGDFWLRYGYSIQNFMSIPSNLMVMTKFTYWKMQETYISSAPMPETFKQSIRGIFEKGVTVWKTPSDIGNIDISTNQPIAGIRY
jgi:hypothetical protein